MDLSTAPLFFDNAEYAAASDRVPYSDFLKEGVVQKDDATVVPKNGTLASPDAGGATRGMSVDVIGGGTPAGTVWVQGDDTPDTQGLYRVYIAESRSNLSVAANATGSTRTDSVVVRVYDSPAYVATLEVLTGPTGGAAPTIPNNTMELARISVANGATQIVASNITDVRPYAYRQSLYGQLAGSNVRCQQSQWTTLCTTGTFTLAKPRRVLVSARANFVTVAAQGATSYGLVYLDVADSYNGGADTSVGLFSGPIELGVTDYQVARWMNSITTVGDPLTYFPTWGRGGLDIPLRAVELAAGTHNLKLQAGRDANNVIDAAAPTTVASRNVARTWIQAVL